MLEMTELRNAAALNWSAIDVSIFGTLFERGLDPAKRSQLGAHYTDPATIMRIIEPVLQCQLLQKWERTKLEIAGLQAKSIRKGDKNNLLARSAFIQWLAQLKAFRVLDPACGSGNFLFLGLKALKDIELKSHLEAAALGLDREADLVTGPHNLLGIELNEYAAELARVTVWIGELQWRLTHGFDFKTNPVLESLDHIECRDALIAWVPAPLGQGRAGDAPVLRAVEAAWPWASVVVGNPPFLGGSKKRRELGGVYFEALDTVFKGRVPGGADLVCYWFDKARLAVEQSGLGAAGFVATQSIRSGSNRVVLEAILRKVAIFDAWSDEAWVNEGAAVRVSLVSFGWVAGLSLNGESVDCVTAELGSSLASDMSLAQSLLENHQASFEGTKKYGDFDVSGQLARHWLSLPNPHGRPNSDVVKPWRNGQDITGRPSDTWIIDFGVEQTEADASLFEAPFIQVQRAVKPQRIAIADGPAHWFWWRHERPRPLLRKGLAGLSRFLVTPRVAKHRLFVFLDATVLPDSRLNVIARADDLTFGILSSRLHEVWSLANASMHGVGNDPTYNAKSCFETFTFPHGLTPADTAHQTTETLPGGETIPAGLLETSVSANSTSKPGVVKAFTAGIAIKKVANSAVTCSGQVVRTHAIAIAQAAYRLNALREA